MDTGAWELDQFNRYHDAKDSNMNMNILLIKSLHICCTTSSLYICCTTSFLYVCCNSPSLFTCCTTSFLHICCIASSLFISVVPPHRFFVETEIPNATQPYVAELGEKPGVAVLKDYISQQKKRPVFPKDGDKLDEVSVWYPVYQVFINEWVSK